MRYEDFAQIFRRLPYGEGKPLKTSTKRPSDEGCVISHCLQWSPLLPNEVGRNRRERFNRELMALSSYLLLI